MARDQKITVVPEASVESFDAAHRLLGSPPPQTSNPRITLYWNRKVSTLCTLDQEPDLQKLGGNVPLQERHQLYLRLLIALVYYYWNGFKRGRPGGPLEAEYPMNDPATRGDPPAYDGEYFGHNIAALAVDEKGRVLDFDFNHNNVFNSSAEHAEARLVRRLFSLSQVNDMWSSWTEAAKTSAVPSPAPAAVATKPAAPKGPGVPSHNTYQSLPNVTIYTSLESCAQCSGIMALAQVRQVIYLQTDPGAVFIGRILRNLINSDRLKAPLPISGKEVDMDCFAELNDGYDQFARTISPTNPFWKSKKDPAQFDKEPSVTSFLCTSNARAIYRRYGTLPADAGALRAPDYVPSDVVGGPKNSEVLEGVTAFLDYAKSRGRRATPHV